MFGNFVFPDGSKPQWESLCWIQKEFMRWLNAERLRTILTFPVVSVSLLYKDGVFEDEDMAGFVAKEYSEGNSFFTYISDSVDSLASCCFTKDTEVLWKSSTNGVKITTLEELHNTKWEDKKNLRIYHNGSWVSGKSIKLPNRKVFEVVTENNNKYYMTDNHINITYRGEVTTEELTENDYLMFNTKVLNPVKENDEHLTYEQGLLIGLFIGDGTFDNYTCLDGSVHSFQLSLNESKWNLVKDKLSILGNFRLGSVYNNVYPVCCTNKELTTFIAKWTGNEPGNTNSSNKNLNLNCLLQSVEFRQGILDGWYITDGGNSNRCYTISKSLVNSMKALCTSLGKQCVVDISDRTDEAVIIRGESYSRNYPLYCLRWYSDTNTRIRPESGFKWKNNSIYWKIKSIKEVEYSDEVYCIECSNSDEPYFTLPSGLITHNCRLKNKIQTHEFNFTNGNIGVMTGSKSVITLNMNRIIQEWFKTIPNYTDHIDPTTKAVVAPNDFILGLLNESFPKYLGVILERVYKYHEAYNELLWDLYNSQLLPAYSAGFIDLNKQYLTIGINGFTASAEFLGFKCNNNEEYSKFCQLVFGTIKEQNAAHKTKKTNFNTECIPAESCGVKLYNADKNDGYWVPNDINLYTSYIFKPYDESVGVLEKFILHGRNYIGEYLDGGSACHVNLDSHPSFSQCKQLLMHAAEVGCSYWTINVPNSECDECGYITKHPITECPKCGSKKISYWDRIIGYMTKISNWSKDRQIEQKKRIYSKPV